MRKLFDIDLYITRYIFIGTHSVHPPPSLMSTGGIEPPTKFSKREGLVLLGPQFLEAPGLVGKKGGELFQGGCNFYIKSKLKYEVFNDKKS